MAAVTVPPFAAAASAPQADVVGQETTTEAFSFAGKTRSELIASGWDFAARSREGTLRETARYTGFTPSSAGLRVVAGRGDLWRGMNSSRNSLFRDLPRDWSRVELRLTFAPRDDYQQAGIAVYDDDDNYVLLTRKHESAVGGQAVSLIAESDGNAVETAVRTEETALILRLERSGDTTTGAFSTDGGATWADVGTSAQHIADPRIGIIVGADESQGPDPAATLHEVAVTTPAATPSPGPSATRTPTSTPAPGATRTPTSTPAPSATRTPSPVPSATRTPSHSPTPSATRTPTPTPTATPTTTPRPAPTPSATPTTTPTITPTPAPTTPPPDPEATLDLPTEPWHGGPSYYAQFPNAAASGWGDEGFFPIAVFFGKPEHAAALAAVGVNTYMGAEHDGSPISRVTREGISVIAQDEWTDAEVAGDRRVVGWHLSDECEMGYGACERAADQHGRLAIQRELAAEYGAKRDGRFLQANFGNGVLGTHWAPHTMPDHLELVDVSSVDKYAYTSPHVQELLPTSPYWPDGKDPESAGAYGWQQDRMESFTPGAATPNWVFVETAKPYLTEPGAHSIAVPEISGAVWNAIIHGASGIAYFQHNNDGCGNYSLVQCSSSLRDGVAAINRKVASLALVINSETYIWDFGGGLDTALKARDGYAYIFAMTDGGSGARTFTLPPGTTGSSIEVVGENRALRVVNGTFTDTFAAEHSHHVYRIRLG